MRQPGYLQRLPAFKGQWPRRGCCSPCSSVSASCCGRVGPPARDATGTCPASQQSCHRAAERQADLDLKHKARQRAEAQAAQAAICREVDGRLELRLHRQLLRLEEAAAAEVWPGCPGQGPH